MTSPWSWNVSSDNLLAKLFIKTSTKMQHCNMSSWLKQNSTICISKHLYLSNFFSPVKKKVPSSIRSWFHSWVPSGRAWLLTSRNDSTELLACVKDMNVVEASNLLQQPKRAAAGNLNCRYSINLPKKTECIWDEWTSKYANLSRQLWLWSF